MRNAGRITGHAAALIAAVTLLIAPARAQIAGFDGGGGGQDMMTQMAPVLNMMKAKMGKRRFGTLMQTMGPMMGSMMQGGGLGAGGFGGLSGFGGGTSTIGSDAFSSPAGGLGGGSGIMGVLGGSDGSGMMTMIPQLVSLAGSSKSHHRRRRR